MKNNFMRLLSCALLALIPLSVSSCTKVSKPEDTTPVVYKDPTSFEYFIINTPGYPTTMHYYENKELLKKANSRSPIYISLGQQRGRLYVNGQVALDWPVSTGVSKHPTPAGSYKVQDKKVKYASRTYGKMYDADGKCVNRDADSRKDAVPEGGNFAGASMPYWHRLTGCGIGMHTGPVRAGRRLSHGCIRTLGCITPRLYKITSIGTPVHVVSGVEGVYPGHAALQYKAEQVAAAKAAEAAANAKRSKKGKAQITSGEVKKYNSLL